jgi:RimJ/RimL family protein N-acetyltransferase
MVGSRLIVRPATREDLPRLRRTLEGRSVFSAMWSARASLRTDRLLYVGFDARGSYVGWIRFDLNPGTREAVASVALVPQARGRGLGGQLVDRGSEACFREQPVECIHAYVGRGNEPSRRAFLAAGYCARTDKSARGERPLSKGARSGAVHHLVRRRVR